MTSEEKLKVKISLILPIILSALKIKTEKLLLLGFDTEVLQLYLNVLFKVSDIIIVGTNFVFSIKIQIYSELPDEKLKDLVIILALLQIEIWVDDVPLKSS